MVKARILAYGAILLMLGATIFYKDLLVITILKDPYLPLGTIVAWLSLGSLTVLPWLSSSAIREGRTLYFLVLKYVTWLAGTLAILWPFLGRLLAGNWHYSFSNISSFVGSIEAGYLFWRLTGLIVVLPFVVFVLILGHYLVRKL